HLGGRRLHLSRQRGLRPLPRHLQDGTRYTTRTPVAHTHSLADVHLLGLAKVVFKPFKGEIITGKVRSSTVDGLYVSLGFFEDVFIPASELQTPSTFVHKENLWMWSYVTEEGASPVLPTAVCRCVCRVVCVVSRVAD